MNQPSLFRDILRIECVMCGAAIQEGDTLNAPKAQDICEECLVDEYEMRSEYEMAVEKVE